MVHDSVRNLKSLGVFSGANLAIEPSTDLDVAWGGLTED
jgi:hypothetical protein